MVAIGKQLDKADKEATEAFLPFDLEFLRASAIHLLMAGAIFPHMTDDQPYNQRHVHLILDEMIHRGNKVAEARKAELCFLELAFQELSMRLKQQDLQTLSWFDAAGETRMDAETMGGREERPQRRQSAYQQQQNQQYGPGPDVGIPSAITDPTDISSSIDRDEVQPLESVGFLDNIGISSDEFFDIVDQMGNQDYSVFGVLDL